MNNFLDKQEEYFINKMKTKLLNNLFILLWGIMDQEYLNIFNNIENMIPEIIDVEYHILYYSKNRWVKQFFVGCKETYIPLNQ